MSIAMNVRMIKGNLGMYIAYWLEGFSHLRLMANRSEEEGVWVVMEEPLSDWMPMTCLRVLSWEAQAKIASLAVRPKRDECWEMLEKHYGRKDIMANEWFDEGFWHVVSIEPKSKSVN